MDRLLHGFKKFVDQEYCDHDGTMPQLVEEGQDPEYFIISCIDSRSNPGTIFQSKPGTFFAHKAMGAIVRPYKKGTALAAALQFAIGVMGVKKLVVLGHTHCGAIKALVNKIDDEEIASFVEVAQEGLDHACDVVGHSEPTDELYREAEHSIVLQSVKNLMTYPSVKKAHDENKLIIKPWVFNMSSAEIEEYDEAESKFKKISI